MYELYQAGEHCYYVQSPAKIGIVKVSEKEVCLIDSGSDKDAGRRVRKILDEQGWKLTAIYNTHSNADHIGGNRYLQQQIGCKIYAPGMECDFTNHPVLEPSFLYGGCPPKELRHKFLLAQESKALPLEEAALPEEVQMIPLPGHFFDMVGFRHRGDDVVYLADCLSSRETLDKYQIGFIYDVAAYLETLERVKTMTARQFIPAHADAAEDIRELAQYNMEKVLSIAGQIEELCSEPMNFEKILQRLFQIYELKMDFQQYALVGSTVRSYLSWLKETGRLEAFFKNEMLLWKRV